MTTNVPGAGATRAPGVRTGRAFAGVTRATETRAAYRTTEFLAYLAVVAAVVIAGAVADGFGARDVWLFVTILTVGYMVSRGLAKSGSYEREWDGDDD
jgi:hypothetical protein